MGGSESRVIEYLTHTRIPQIGLPTFIIAHFFFFLLHLFGNKNKLGLSIAYIVTKSCIKHIGFGYNHVGFSWFCCSDQIAVDIVVKVKLFM